MGRAPQVLWVSVGIAILYADALALGRILEEENI